MDATFVSASKNSKIMEIKKSLNDDRQYEFIQLDNKLDVILISDPKTEKSSACLDIFVGNFLDPEKIQGLAHFCEHMLFLGTEKYPEEGIYKSFIKKHGGYCNASTSVENTRYYFDIICDAFEEALNIFSSFFVSPLFLQNCVEREINAVHSEFCKNIQKDTRRMYQLIRASSNPKHPFSKFGTGNIETLKEIPQKLNLSIRDELVTFYKQYYSPNLMKLCILGKEPLNILKKWAIEKFGIIKNYNVVIPKYNGVDIFQYQKCKIFKIVPVKDVKKLTLMFPIQCNDSYEEQYQKKPHLYYSNLIGHEGEGSLLGYLRKRQWADELSCGMKYQFSSGSLFCIDISMTESGENHLLEVIYCAFSYIEMLRKEGVKRWIWEEERDIAEILFRYEEKADPSSVTTSCARRMHFYPYHHVLCGDICLFEYDEQAIVKFLDQLSMPNSFILHCSDQHNNLITNHSFKEEKWYKTKYIDEEISDEWKNVIQNAGNQSFANINTSDFHLPFRNEFIPTDFSIKSPDTVISNTSNQTHVPEIVFENDAIQMWYKQDTVFKVPKINMNYQIIIPGSNSSPLFKIFSKIYCTLIADALNQSTYSANLLQYTFKISDTRYGLSVKVRGFHEKIHKLVEKIFSAMTAILNEECQDLAHIREYFQTHYTRVMQAEVKKIRNGLKKQPHEYAEMKASKVLIETKFDTEDLLLVLKDNKLEYNEFLSFTKTWLHSYKIIALLHGNMTRQEALSHCEKLTNIMMKEGNFHKIWKNNLEMALRRMLQLDDSYQDYVISLKHPNHSDINSCLRVMSSLGTYTIRKSVLLHLFYQTVHALYYCTMRTKEQLGYIVTSKRKKLGNILFYITVVQSSSHNPIYLLDRNDNFFRNILPQYLHQMTEEEVEERKKAIKQIILEKDKQLLDETSRHWDEIKSMEYEFNREKRKVMELERLTKTDLIQFFERFIDPLSFNCKRLVMQVFSSKACSNVRKDDESSKLRKHYFVKDIEHFKRCQNLYPLVIDLE